MERIRTPEGIRLVEELRNPDYPKEIDSISGIGEKMVKDILSVFPTYTSLYYAIKENKHIPFRDDIVDKLRRYIDG